MGAVVVGARGTGVLPGDAERHHEHANHGEQPGTEMACEVHDRAVRRAGLRRPGGAPNDFPSAG
jgi:hypothetical protein